MQIINLTPETVQPMNLAGQPTILRPSGWGIDVPTAFENAFVIPTEHGGTFQVEQETRVQNSHIFRITNPAITRPPTTGKLQFKADIENWLRTGDKDVYFLVHKWVRRELHNPQLVSWDPKRKSLICNFSPAYGGGE